MLKTGDVVQDFEGIDDHGEPIRLSDLLLKGPVVLFFYPAAMTHGCTIESCHFRDLAAEFAAAGGQRVGISRDAVDKQHQFSDKHGFDYPLLSDAAGEVSAQYGVKRGGLAAKLAPTRRVTFVIGADQTILDVITGELKSHDHADKALAALGAG